LHKADDGFFGQKSKHICMTLLSLLSQMNLIFYDIPHANTLTLRCLHIL
jgi:hypothetical protein